MSITIPWQAIKNQPARIEIDDVYVLARARPQGKVDPEEDARVEQAMKQNKLKEAEVIDSTTSQVDQDAEQHESESLYFRVPLADLQIRNRTSVLSSPVSSTMSRSM